MQPIKNQISPREKRIYAMLQGASWFLVFVCLALFASVDDQTWKKVALVGLVGFLLAAVVFNYGRRFGIRVLWSKKIRD